MSSSRLMDRMRSALRTHHYSLRTEESYLYWVRRYILFHGKQHHEDMGKEEITEFLSHLAIEKNVAATPKI
jgi:hypothetical protein